MSKTGKYDVLKEKNKKVMNDATKAATHIQAISDEYQRVAEIYSSPNIILNNIDEDFKTATQLDGVDATFLFFATALQCIRQYFLTQFKLEKERPTDQEAADSIFHRNTKSNRVGYNYDPSLKEIWENPVPFDAIEQEDAIKGIFKNTGRFAHRTTLGHDPILGWVVGTANIATSTLTTWDWNSYHVRTGPNKKDKICEPAVTGDVFKHTLNKLLCKEGKIDGNLLDEGYVEHNRFDKIAGPTIIALSLILEWEHLHSDINSRKSLPFPIVTSISPKVAGKLAEYGLDMCNLATVGKQATYATLINFMIAVIHRMIYNEASGLSPSLYEVKTRKILTYSNVIATSSNVIAVAATEIVAAVTENADLAKKGLKYFDIGGLAVTLHRLVTDHKFIEEVKREFIANQWYDIVVGDNYDFVQGDK